MTAGPILCGVDFSEDSRDALRVSASLAKSLRRQLVVLTVMDPLLAEAAKTKMGETGMVYDVEADLRAFIADTSEIAVQPTTHHAVGHPPEVLIEEATRRNAAMIAVGTRGLGRTKRLLFGSTTLRTLRKSTVPVLAVPTDAVALPPSAFSDVLCGVDFSDQSLAAARTAVDLGTALNIPVTLLHVVAPVTVPAAWDALVVGSVDSRVEETTSRLQEVARALHSQAPAAIVRIGEISEVLAEEAGRFSSPLIVVGLGGRDAHRPGTHAYRVLTHSKTPVLSVPG